MGSLIRWLKKPSHLRAHGFARPVSAASTSSVGAAAVVAASPQAERVEVVVVPMQRNSPFRLLRATATTTPWIPGRAVRVSLAAHLIGEQYSALRSLPRSAVTLGAGQLVELAAWHRPAPVTRNTPAVMVRTETGLALGVVAARRPVRPRTETTAVAARAEAAARTREPAATAEILDRMEVMAVRPVVEVAAAVTWEATPAPVARRNCDSLIRSLEAHTPQRPHQLLATPRHRPLAHSPRNAPAPPRLSQAMPHVRHPSPLPPRLRQAPPRRLLAAHRLLHPLLIRPQFSRPRQRPWLAMPPQRQPAKRFRPARLRSAYRMPPARRRWSTRRRFSQPALQRPWDRW